MNTASTIVSTDATNLFSQLGNSNRSIYIALIILCILISLFFNCTCFATIVCHRHLRKQPIYSLLLNCVLLSIIDSSFVQLLTAFSVVYDGMPAYFTEAVCISQSFVVSFVTVCISATFLLAAIDRITTIRSLLTDAQSRTLFGSSNILVLSILILWLISVCFCVPLVTKTIPSSYKSTLYTCTPDMDFVPIYKYSILCLGLLVPALACAGMYVFMLHVVFEHHRYLCQNHQVIENVVSKEIRNTAFTFTLNLFWIVMFSPHLFSLYNPVDISDLLLIVFFLMRCYFFLIPFLLLLSFFRSFRTSLKQLFCHKRQLQDCNNSTTTISQQNTQSSHVTNTHDNASMHIADEYSDDYTSNVSSVRSTDYREVILPSKVPVLFLTDGGIHVKYNNHTHNNSNNNLPGTSYYHNTMYNDGFDSSEADIDYNSEGNMPTNKSASFKRRKGHRKQASLCDVNEASCTDFSESMSITPSSSFRVYKSTSKRSRSQKIDNDETIKRKAESNTFNLPYDIQTFYDPKDMSAKCGRSKSSQNQKKSKSSSVHHNPKTARRSVINVDSFEQPGPSSKTKPQAIIQSNKMSRSLPKSMVRKQSISVESQSSSITSLTQKNDSGPFYSENESKLLAIKGQTNQNLSQNKNKLKMNIQNLQISAIKTTKKSTKRKAPPPPPPPNS